MNDVSQAATAIVRDRLHGIGALEEILPAVQSAAAGHAGVYLVGGAVRDVLLGEQSVDLDVMVEGDAIAFAAELAHALDGHSHPHAKFETAVVKATGGDGHEIRVDVASARTETYASPGALPDVTRGTLREDLARRDFTINAMATSLRAEDFGATYDFCGGYDDLQAKTVRVLHDQSFVEDPTRVLRALRYEARLGFRMDAATEALARGVAASGVLAGMASTRVRDELQDLLAEERAIAAMQRMAELGVDRALHPQADAAAGSVLAETAARHMTGGLAGARLELVRLACLAAEMTERDLRDWLDRLKFARHDRDVVVDAVTASPAVATQLARPDEPASSGLHAILADRPLEVDVMAIVLAWDPEVVGRRVAAYFERSHGVRLEITGDDLRQAGIPESPAIGSALQQTLALKLDGVVAGREQELAAALRIARE